MASGENDPTDDLEVRDNPRELRYELWSGDSLVGEIRYRTQPGAIVLVHTEIDPAVESHGFGSFLVRGALDDIRNRGLRVVPVCPFVAAYLKRHPEYRDLVAGDESTPD